MKLSISGRNLRRDLLIGIIASALFAYLFDPVAKLVWNGLSTNASTFAGAIQDLALSHAAMGQRSWIDALLFLIILAGAMFLTLGISLNWSQRIAFEEETESEEETEPKKLEQIPEVTKSKWLRARIFFLNPPRFFLVLLDTVIVVSCLWLGFLTYVDLQLNTSFNQRLAAIAPYIDPLEEKKLKSLWALMEKQKDYFVINLLMETHAQKAGIKLPPLLYK